MASNWLSLSNVVLGSSATLKHFQVACDGPDKRRGLRSQEETAVRGSLCQYHTKSRASTNQRPLSYVMAPSSFLYGVQYGTTCTIPT
eukprot:scaffold4990_cov176-Amphora_coffeaeformis.AAC.4